MLNKILFNFTLPLLAFHTAVVALESSPILSAVQVHSIVKGSNCYNLRLVNPPDLKRKKLKFISKNCLGYATEIAKGKMNKNGRIELTFIDGSKVLLENYIVYAEGMCKGESFDIILLSEDKTFEVSAHIVMHPIENCSPNGQRISVELRSRYGSIYQCFGDGYLPNEELKTISRSENENIVQYINATEDGTFTFGLMPMVIGKTDGVASITIQRRNGDSLSLDYPWGKNSINKVTF